MKTFDADAFIKDCSVLPFNIINCFDDPDDQTSCMNKLFRECIEQHAPLRKIKVTRPLAPWLNNDEIRHLQNCRNKLHKEAHSTGSEKAWQLFRDARNKLKTLIRHAKMCFYRKALSSNKPREVWKIIHRIVKPGYKPLHFDVEKRNKLFAEIPTHTISNCECTTLNQIIEGLPERVPIDEQFILKTVSRVDILNTIKSLKSDNQSQSAQIDI